METVSNDWYAERLAQLRDRVVASEADVSDAVVRPVLENVLNFNHTEIFAQPSHHHRSGSTLRPDYVCRREGAVKASVIVEVKNRNVDLMKRTSTDWKSSPIGQLHNYLNGLRESGVGTWGILTNGFQWIVTRREADKLQPFEYRPQVPIRSLQEIEQLLREISQAPPSENEPVLDDEVIDWLKVVAECDSTENFINRVAESNLFSNCHLQDTHAYQLIGENDSDIELLPRQYYLACLQLNFPDGLLSPDDISNTISELIPPGADVVGVAYNEASSTLPRLCRGFISKDKQLFATTLIDPRLPGSRTERQFIELSKNWTQSDKVVKALSSAPLQEKFYQEVGQWFGFNSEGIDDLGHLIRVMFAWLLQVRGVLPDNALWDQGRVPTEEHEIHRHVMWLFTDVLAKPRELRTPESDDWKNMLVETIPFLNGSLFSNIARAGMPSELKNGSYIGNKGLLTILSGYDWTLHDRKGHVSESALDPTMLGDMFEHLILQTEGARVEGKKDSVRLKMPHGTYYTPQDVAEEMAADAIASWLQKKIPKVNWVDTRNLFHPMPTNRSWRNWDPLVCRRCLQSLNEVTVLDPCCGSGVFTLSILHALWRAHRRLSKCLNKEFQSGAYLEHAIERQLYAVDIHPMAVLITRLRLFIALIDAQSRDDVGNGNRPKPLPNLETRCIAANTLCIEQRGSGFLGRSDERSYIEELRTAREMWTVAHYPEEKDIALSVEKKARLKLYKLLDAWRSDDEYSSWLKMDFLSSSVQPAQIDIRKLFPAPNGGGWDIVIGNPPYQVPDRADKLRGKELGYIGGATNLYLMFIEAALKIVRLGGCVTFVVPHSIVFSRKNSFIQIRNKMKLLASRIDIRTYDNMPQPLFPPLPWLREQQNGKRTPIKQNRQRATIINLLRRVEPHTDPGNATESKVYSSGLIRLNSANRGTTLMSLGTRQLQPHFDGQWTQAPTKELADLLKAMHDKDSRLRPEPALPKIITFPPTAMYFLSCLPYEVFQNPSRKKYKISDDKFYWPWIGLYNSNLFHAYWLMLGDAFHVNQVEYCSIRAPKGWNDESLRCEIERNAKRLMEPNTLASCAVVKNNLGPQHNFNFHKEGTLGPSIIAELDVLLLDSYDIDANRLVHQMKAIRTGSAHHRSLQT